MVCSSHASESQHARDMVLSQVVKSLAHVPAGERNPRACCYYAASCCTVPLLLPGMEQVQKGISASLLGQQAGNTLNLLCR